MKSKKPPTDLHYSKDSHVSAPITHNMEWHLAPEDGSGIAEPNQVYEVCIPAICTSRDDKGERFKQVAKPYVREWQANPAKPESENSRINKVTDKLRSDATPKRKGVKFQHEDIGPSAKREY